MKKRKNRGGLVYSTDNSFEWEEDQEAPELLPPNKQNLRIRLDRLKGNKRATVVYQFEGPDEALKDLGKSLKSKCGCGGSTKNGEIILQGDFREKVGTELERLGYRYKFVGG
ncbi:MAG: translation initiation factor [Bacteroidota bacterium]